VLLLPALGIGLFGTLITLAFVVAAHNQQKGRADKLQNENLELISTNFGLRSRVSSLELNAIRLHPFGR
jgi:hypothetical protein